MSHALLALQRVSAAYASQPVFTDLDLCLTPGQFAALVGPTGGGKSTLLKLILGLLPCTRGHVQRLPQVTMGYVPQREMIDWRFPVTAEQVVLMGRYRHTSYWPWATRADRREAAALLDRLGLAPYAGGIFASSRADNNSVSFSPEPWWLNPSSYCSMNPLLAWI